MTNLNLALKFVVHAASCKTPKTKSVWAWSTAAPKVTAVPAPRPAPHGGTRAVTVGCFPGAGKGIFVTSVGQMLQPHFVHLSSHKQLLVVQPWGAPFLNSPPHCLAGPIQQYSRTPRADFPR